MWVPVSYVLPSCHFSYLALKKAVACCREARMGGVHQHALPESDNSHYVRAEPLQCGNKQASISIWIFNKRVFTIHPWAFCTMLKLVCKQKTWLLRLLCVYPSHAYVGLIISTRPVTEHIPSVFALSPPSSNIKHFLFFLMGLLKIIFHVCSQASRGGKMNGYWVDILFPWGVLVPARRYIWFISDQSWRAGFVTGIISYTTYTATYLIYR